MTNNNSQYFSTESVILERLDLMTFEAKLCAALRHFIDFKGHSLQFPLHEASTKPVFIEAERKLFLPLRPADSLADAINDEASTALGIFVASGVRNSAEIKAILNILPAMTALVLENLRLYKASISDPVTGLYTRDYLLEALTKEMDSLHDSFAPSPLPAAHMATGPEESEKSADKTPIYARGSFALMVIRFNGLREVVREHGYMVADKLLAALGKEISTHCHEQTLPARSGDYECTLLLPSTTATECRQLTLELLPLLSKANITHELTGKRIRIAPSFGYTLCPQDLTGILNNAPTEQSRALLRKARLAAALAHEHPPANAVGIAKNIPVLGFGRILEEGGYVLGPLPLSRYLISIGRNVNAREGQRFAVWQSQEKDKNSELPTNIYKGEMVVVEVRENDSLAELINSNDPSNPPASGDKLLLLPLMGSGIQQGGKNPEKRLDPSTNLMTHSDFMAEWCVENEKSQTSSLVLMHFASNDTPHQEEDASLWEPIMQKAAELSQKELGSAIPHTKSEEIIGGRYGYNSLIFFMPETTPEKARETCITLAKNIETGLNLTLTAGIAPHPFLDFRKSDAPENARKALEYSALLEAPHVGILDSLALNINADKLFSIGESFAAISEYKRAILADDNNTMAWNSLGVCFAGLGKPKEARRNFEEALKRSPNDLMALYNLGRLYHSVGEEGEATALYKRCLELAPDHLYAAIRIGQIFEEQGKNEQARDMYQRAASLPGGQGLTRRHVAKLAAREGNTQEAREQLHEALIYDPQDAVALQLLAHLYLDGGDDPQVAESLARQSVALRPDLKAGWMELSRAFSATGKPEEAKKALVRAGEL